MASKLAKVFRSYVVDGLLLVALGVVILLWPDDSLTVLCAIIGVVLIIMGLVKGVLFFVDRDVPTRPMDLLTAILQLVAGVVVMVQSSFFISLFQILVGVILLYGSVLLFVRAIQLRQVRGFPFAAALVGGVLVAALGAVIIMNPPAFASFMMQLQGVAIIFLGVALIIVMQRIRSDANAMNAGVTSPVSLRARPRPEEDDDGIDVEAEEEDPEYDVAEDEDAEYGRMTAYRNRR